MSFTQSENELVETVDRHSKEIDILKRSTLKLAEVVEDLTKQLSRMVQLNKVLQKAVFSHPEQFDKDIAQELFVLLKEK